MKYTHITAIILAGGKSSRMGQEKGFVLLHDKPLIEYILTVLKTVFEKIIIIANDAAYEKYHYPVFRDIFLEKGALGGVYTGLFYTETTMNFIISTDMPFVNQEAITYFIAKSLENQISIAQNKDKYQPLFACYPNTLLAIIKTNIEANQLKLIHFVMENKAHIIPMDSFEEENPLLFANLNTLEEVQRVEQQTLSISVAAFGYLTEIIGKEAITFEGITTTHLLIEKLNESYPALKNATYQVVVNNHFIHKEIALQHKDKVALFPPFSGG
ncbi:MAG: NTP transferase domain-containing protein [Bacteroidia bacterium]